MDNLKRYITPQTLHRLKEICEIEADGLATPAEIDGMITALVDSVVQRREKARQMGQTLKPFLDKMTSHAVSVRSTTSESRASWAYLNSALNELVELRARMRVEKGDFRFDGKFQWPCPSSTVYRNTALADQYLQLEVQQNAFMDMHDRGYF